MRIFTVRKGKFIGEHIIWDNVQEAEAHKITNIKTPWYRDDVQGGDWCVADDGFVLQCLYRRKLFNKTHISGQFTDTFRFANGLFYVYHGKNGNQLIKNFYGGIVNSQKNSMSTVGKFGKYLTLKKKMFCTLLAGGMDPYHAYLKAYAPLPTTRSSILGAINKLLNDEYVRKELMEQLQPFIDKVTVEIKEKTGYESLKDFLAAKITEVATDIDASNKDKVTIIRLMIDLFGEQLGLVAPKGKDLKQIPATEYEAVAPPTLQP